MTAVLVWDLELRPHSVARRYARLWLHPEPRFAQPGDLPWSVVTLRDRELQITAGNFDPARVPELPDLDQFVDPRDWPGELFAAGA